MEWLDVLIGLLGFLVGYYFVSHLGATGQAA